MFYPKDILGMVETEGMNVFFNNRKAYHVKLHMVQFSHDGMVKIGQFIQDAAQRFGLHPMRIKELMADKMYVAPPNQSLYFLFTIPELEADVHVEIPKTFWQYTDFVRETPTVRSSDESAAFGWAV